MSIKYKAHVFTDVSGKYGGTNSKITIKLVGTKGTTDYISLDKSDVNDFEKSVETFTLDHKDLKHDIGEVIQLSVTSDCNDGWLLEKINIEKIKSGARKVYTFIHGGWMGDKGVGYGTKKLTRKVDEINLILKGLGEEPSGSVNQGEIVLSDHYAVYDNIGSDGTLSSPKKNSIELTTQQVLSKIKESQTGGAVTIAVDSGTLYTPSTSIETSLSWSRSQGESEEESAEFSVKYESTFDVKQVPNKIIFAREKMVLYFKSQRIKASSGDFDVFFDFEIGSSKIDGITRTSDVIDPDQWRDRFGADAEWIIEAYEQYREEMNLRGVA